MPLYEGIVLSSEKNAIVFDFGHAYTKCGFTGENGPRCIIASEIRQQKIGKVVRLYELTDDDLYGALVDFIHLLYFRHLLVNPKERRVVIVESFLCTTKFRNMLVKVFFRHFEVPSILFTASHIMAALTLGVPSCLVMDCGYYETVVLPVYEGIALLKAHQVLPIAGQAIHQRLEALLCELSTIKVGHDSEVSVSSAKESLTNQVLEDIKVRTCFVTKLERAKAIASNTDVPSPPSGVDYPLGGKQLVSVDGKIRETACEVLFEWDADEVSVATLILDSLIKCPIDTRRSLAENILLTGGTTMLAGFKHRLMSELHELRKLPKYKDKLAIETFKFHSPPAKENYVAWLGGAIFGSLDVVHIRSLIREQYLKGAVVPDWCSLMDADEMEEKSILTKVASFVKVETN